MRRYRGIPYMNDFQSVKQRDGAWNFRDQDDHATVQGPTFVGKSRHLTMLSAARFRCAEGWPPDLRDAAHSSFIRWENVGCNVIYLARTQ